jgi:hypothetical protein
MRYATPSKWAGLLLAAASCAAPAAPEPAEELLPAVAAPVEPLPRIARASRGEVVVRYAPEPDPIPLNEPFEIDLDIRAAAGDARPVEGAQVFVTGWMPEHLHGMVRRPETVELGGGSYRATGLLFHMPGRWQIRVDVVAGSKPERAVFEVHL